jgi:hypothetical protein
MLVSFCTFGFRLVSFCQKCASAPFVDTPRSLKSIVRRAPPTEPYEVTHSLVSFCQPLCSARSRRSLGHAHISRSAAPQTRWPSCKGACPTVPSPLVGEGQGEGRRRRIERKACLVHRRKNDCISRIADMKQRRCVLFFTPLPVPPPQGGRERCGTALPNRRRALELGSA